ncbi:MAG: hypothetical protein E6Z64_00715 [Streptococcus parasanguinis]|nr:hypothetical protein [Streptococcus parasanguinis]MDU5844127.1 hypothetical protein [Streptococcus parasanguinis]
MNNFKQILLALVAVFATVLLVACGQKSDNGTYVFEPTTEEVREILPREVAYIITDDYKFKVSITIKDKKGVMKVQIKSNIQNTNQPYDFKVDQKTKTIILESEYSKTKVTYQISGGVLTIKNVSDSGMNNSDAYINFIKFAKFKKIK